MTYCPLVCRDDKSSAHFDAVQVAENRDDERKNPSATHGPP
jgi:hypothetical protein